MTLQHSSSGCGRTSHFSDARTGNSVHLGYKSMKMYFKKIGKLVIMYLAQDLRFHAASACVITTVGPCLIDIVQCIIVDQEKNVNE